MEEKNNEMFVQIAKLPLFMQSVSRFENRVQPLSQTVASYDAKITIIEQLVSSFAARVTTLQTNATSVSSGSRDDLGPWDPRDPVALEPSLCLRIFPDLAEPA